MRALLISANTETINMPTLPLGAACVAAATREAGHEAALLNLMFTTDREESLRRTIRDFRPDVIGVSVRNIDDQNMDQPQFLLPPIQEVVVKCRTLSDAPVIAGGAGYSIFPESALRYLGADAGVQGEGEAVFPLLLEQFGRGEPLTALPGVHAAGRQAKRMDFVRELDDLPLPEADLWLPPVAGNHLWVPVQTRRGCPLDCTYCSTSLIEGRYVRMRSPRRVAAWMKTLREKGFRYFNFVDNTFNLPPAYPKELCREIIRAGMDIEFWAIIYPRWVDSELVELMKESGCTQVSLGFESGSDPVLEALNKQFDAKEAGTVSRMFREAGIERRGFLLLGAPGETRATVEESLAFADSLNLEYVKVSSGLRIYPETPLARRAAAEGIIGPEEDLLQPQFYVPPDLADWLPERVARYRVARPWAQ